MHPIKLALLAAVACCTVPAMAQWQWIDGQGHKVFSDRAPPPDIPGKNILRQPGAAVSRQAAPPAGTGGTADPATVAAAPAQPADKGVDKALEEQKRKHEEQEAAKARAEQQQREKQRQDNCMRARQAKAALASGQLLSYTNAKGERGFMDDATREAEARRADAVMASDCGRAP